MIHTYYRQSRFFLCTYHLWSHIPSLLLLGYEVIRLVKPALKTHVLIYHYNIGKMYSQTTDSYSKASARTCMMQLNLPRAHSKLISMKVASMLQVSMNSASIPRSQRLHASPAMYLGRSTTLLLLIPPGKSLDIGPARLWEFLINYPAL